LKYVLTDESRVDFIAHAPLHAFKGWAVRGLTGLADLDAAACRLHDVRAAVETRCFDTGDAERNRAMERFFSLDAHPQASFVCGECREFSVLQNKGGGNVHRVTVVGVLDFAGVRRQLPVTGTMRVNDGRLVWDLRFKWSFKAYGLKPPRLLFLTVRDIVDVKAHLEFIPMADKEPANAAIH
jgi:polyisoprenoid-binding protein YceI